MRRLLALWVLAACQAEAESSSDAGGGAGDSPPDAGELDASDTGDECNVSWVCDPPPDPTAALVSTVEVALALRPERLQALFEALLAEGDADCPPREVTEEPGLTSIFIEADCISAAGTRFTGDATYVVRTDAPEGDDGRASGFVLEGGPLVIEAADGRRLTVQGYHELRRIEYPASTEGSVTWQGVALADPASASDDPWLAGTYTGSLDAYSYTDETGYHSLRVVSEMTGLPDAPEAVLEEVRLQTEACISGRWRLTDALGFRHVLSFGAEDAEPCDACAEHVVDGEAAPAFCLAPAFVAELLNWEPRPW